MDPELQAGDPAGDTSSDFDLGAAMDEVAKDLGKPEGTPEPTTETAPASTAPAPVTPPVDETPYPKSWKPDHKEKWNTLDPDVRKEILRREDDFHKGTAPLRAASDFVRRFQQASAPVESMLRSGVDPIQLYSNFAQAHATLSRGGAEAATFLRQLAQDYKIDLDAEPAYVDPALSALQQQVNGLNSQLSAREQADANARRAQVATQVETFAADPKNNLFEVVAGEMTAFLKADPKLTLEAAYEKAIWANPDARKTVLEREVAAKAAADAKAAAEKASKAAAASEGSVRNTARTAPVTGSVGSMDDTMRETLKALRAKA